MARYFTCRNPKQKNTYKSDHLELDKLETILLKQATISVLRDNLSHILDFVQDTDLKRCAFQVEELINLIETIFDIYEGNSIKDNQLVDYLMYYYELAYTYIDEPPCRNSIEECLKFAEMERYKRQFKKSDELSIFD